MSLKTKSDIFLKLFSISLFFVVLILLNVDLGTTANAQAQKGRSKAVGPLNEAAANQQVLYGDYKGVRIGMSTDEARTKLGAPTQAADDQDFWVVTVSETAQIFYDATHKITAISVDYVGDNGGAPNYKAIVGANIEVRPDGSMYKMVRYEELGYWVSYNRTAGTIPIISVTIQKIK